MLTKLRLKLSSFIERLAKAEADPYFLALFRMGYALVAIVVVWRTYQQAGYLWEPGSLGYKTAVYFIFPALVALLLCILVGFGGRAVVILHFLVLCTLNYSFPNVRYLDFRFNQAAAFWMLFMRLNKVWSLDAYLSRERIRREPAPPAWPVYFLGITLSLWLLNAGWLKVVDPMWRDGLGFYYVFLLPWVKSANFNFLLDHLFVLKLLNYTAMAFEVSFIFLYCFRRTRFIAILLAIGFFIYLICPLRVDPVGQFGLVWCLGILSVTPLPKKLERALVRWRRRDDPNAGAAEIPAWHLRLRKYLIVGFAVYIVYLFAVFHVRAMPFYVFRKGLVTFVGYPFALLDGTEKALAKEPRAVRGMKWALDAAYRPLKAVDAPLFTLNQYTTSLQFNGLFGIDHSIAIFLYRVELEMDDGTREEPVKVFNEDMTAGPYSDGLFTPRYIQGAMYGVTGMCHRLATRPGYALSAAEVDVLKRLIGFSLFKLGGERAAYVRRAVIKVRPILVPYDYVGNARTWEARGWTDFYVYEPASGEYRIENLPERYPLQIPLKTFSGGLLVLEP
ncbi:MAG TPA: HTTM domain-containing protein [Pyrinomonadaceae bacterium]|jgi:hypothetical protein